MRTLMIAVAAAAVGLAVAEVQSVAHAAGAATEEQRIRDLDKQWVAAVAKKDVAAITAFYAEDGAILPAGAPMAQGRDAIAKVWGSLVGLKNFALTFAPTKVTVARSRDVAYEVGTYALTFDGDKGPVRDAGKYVVTWKKIKRVWKVTADIFNSNAAAP